LISVSALHQLHARIIGIVTLLLLWHSALALAQSAPEIPPITVGHSTQDFRSVATSLSPWPISISGSDLSQ
jgi:hypothetical protein